MAREKYSVQGDAQEDGGSFFLSWRFALAIIGFFGFMNAYAVRIGMSVGIVCMVNHTALRALQDLENGDSATIVGVHGLNSTLSPNNETAYSKIDLNPACGNSLKQGNASELLDGPFVWDKPTQGHILGSFFYGYLVSQIPAGYLAEKFGGKWVFTGAMLITALGTLLTPIAAELHYGALILIRVLMGVGSGAFYPVFHSIWSRWAPPMERSKLANMSYAGSWLGSVIALPVSGLLCRYGFAGGWPSIFYILGSLCLLWTILWIFLASDSPSDHRFMKQSEKDYIQKSLKGQVSSGKDQHKGGVPWLRILTSLPVWAIIVANVCTDWGLYVFLTQIPTYMREVLKFDVESNGLLSALPFIGLWINMNVSPLIVDKLRSAGVCSTGAVRKIFMSIGSFGAAIFLFGLAFIDCTLAFVAVILLTLGVTVSASVYSAFLVNHMDIAPKYAGTLFGISNGAGSITGFIAPYVVAVMTPTGSQGEWQSVFFVTSAIYAFGAIFYCVFASGELQDWAKSKEEAAEEMVGLNAMKADTNGKEEYA